MNTTQIIIVSLITAASFVKNIIIKTYLNYDYEWLDGLFAWIYQSLMLSAFALLLMYIF